MPRPVQVLCVYSETDQPAFLTLYTHLSSLERSRAIDFRRIEVPQGHRFLQKVDLMGAEIIVLLISPELLVQFDELPRFALLKKQGRVEVVSVLVRPVVWEYTPLANLQVLPDGGKPISTLDRPSQDAAWANVVRGLYRFVLAAARNEERSLSSSALSPRSAASLDSAVRSVPLPAEGPAPSPAPSIPIHEIFRTTGQPDINFVEPEQLGDIRVRLRMMGQGLVVQGPSGVGKTTAVRKALGDLATAPTTAVLSSKKPADLRRLQEILATSLAAGGHLVIDDFHRLAPDLQAQVADLIKILADENRRDAKVTLIGINPVGLSLVRDFPDLANRFAVISLGKQPVEKIDELIKKGAQAANVRFERHAEFVGEAAGSFFTAQLLCLEAALKEGVTETEPTLRRLVTGPVGYVGDKVQQSLAFKYHAPLMAFATCDERPPPRGACLALLWLLSQAEDASISLEAARYRYPRLAPAFDWLMAGHLGRHFEVHPRLRDLFHYNRDAAVLSAEDPQLEFYLRNLRWEAFSRDTGHEGLRWDLERGPLFDTSTAPAVVVERGPGSSPGPLPASSVLHLSDLHFGTSADAALWADQLSADLRQELGCKHLDALILSGDVANRATAEEYQAAQAFLRTIQQEFRPQQTIITPGNHDANWTQAREAYMPMRRADYKGSLEEGQFIDGGPYVEIARYASRPIPWSTSSRPRCIISTRRSSSSSGSTRRGPSTTTSARGPGSIRSRSARPCAGSGPPRRMPTASNWPSGTILSTLARARGRIGSATRVSSSGSPRRAFGSGSTGTCTRRTRRSSSTI